MDVDIDTIEVLTKSLVLVVLTRMGKEIGHLYRERRIFRMSDDEYYKFNVITPFEKLTQKKIEALEKNQKILGNQNLDFMEQIAELRKDLNNHIQCMHGFDSNPTLGDGIPLDARSPATDRQTVKKCADCRKYKTEDWPPWPTKGPDHWCTQYQKKDSEEKRGILELNAIGIYPRVSGGEKEFICGNCGKMFKTYHNGDGYNTGFCPKCLTLQDTVGLDSKLPDLCEECGGYRMGERMMHNDWCSQCTTGTTARKLPEPKKRIKHCIDYQNEYCIWLGGKCEDNDNCKIKKRDNLKEKTEPEKFEFQLIEKFIPPRGIHCNDCMNNPIPKLIEESQADLLSIFECPTLECVEALCNQYIEKWQGRIKR